MVERGARPDAAQAGHKRNKATGLIKLVLFLGDERHFVGNSRSNGSNSTSHYRYSTFNQSHPGSRYTGNCGLCQLKASTSHPRDTSKSGPDGSSSHAV
ncbi:hypothetical protein GDO81_016561 [Engystomops pustulosus]|uniref:Uncharacterized protein n=1 Tax=Engystomops pustulosus TaxID=76066 RepID=A0AAV7B0S1_ENGPU|nr:hypothetical protein GDO81_016561 [Engystomops pustulosus]